MKRMSDKEVAEKVLSEFNDFVKSAHSEYGVGAGMFVISLDDDNMDTLVSSVFGNVRKWGKHWEDRLKDCAIETIEGAARSAKERCEDYKKIDERTIELAKKLGILDEDGEIDMDELKKCAEDCDRKMKDIDELANNLKKVVDRNKC